MLVQLNVRANTATQNGNIQIWDLLRGARTTEWFAHTDGVTAIAVAPRGDVVTAGEDNMIRIWDLALGKITLAIGPLPAIATSLTVSPDGQQLMVGCRDGRTRLYGVDGLLLRELAVHTDEVRALAFTADGRAVTGGADRRVVVWDLTNGRPLSEWSEDGHITALAISPSGGQVAVASIIYDYAGDGSPRGSDRDSATPIVWDDTNIKASAQLWLRSLAGSQREVRLEPTPGLVRMLAFAPKGEEVLSASSDGCARVHVDGVPTRTLAHTGPVTAAFFSTTGAIVTASLDAMVRCWREVGTSPSWPWLVGRDLGAQDRLARRSERETLVARLRAGDLTAIAEARDLRAGLPELRRDSELVYASAVLSAPVAGRVGVADAWVAVGLKHKAVVLGLASAGDLLVTAGMDGMAWIFDAAKLTVRQRLVGHLGAVRACAISADGTMIVTVGQDGTARFWDPAGSPVSILQTPGFPLTSVAFTPDGRHALIGAWPVSPPGWSPVGSAGAVAWHEPAGLLVWDLARRRVERAGAADKRVSAVAVSRSGMWQALGTDDGVVRIWSTDGPHETNIATGVRVAALAITPDDQHMVVGHSEGTLSIWRITGQSVARVSAHRGTIDSLVVTSDGRLAITAAGDQTVGFFQIPSGATAYRFAELGRGALKAVALSGDTGVFAAGRSGNVHFVAVDFEWSFLPDLVTEAERWLADASAARAWSRNAPSPMVLAAGIERGLGGGAAPEVAAQGRLLLESLRVWSVGW